MKPCACWIEPSGRVRPMSRANPFFYVISGFRFGFLGRSDIGSDNGAVLASALGLALFNLALGAATYALLRSGWKLKS